MRRVSKEYGFSVNAMDWVLVRYSWIVIPLIAGLIWYVPYQHVVYRFAESQQVWMDIFPNLRGVLEVPFKDPQRVLGALFVLNILIVGLLAYSLIVGPRYVCAIEGWQERFKYGRKESLKLMLYCVIAMVACFMGVFIQDGRHNRMWGGLFYEYEIALILFNLVLAWVVVFSYLVVIACYIRLKGVVRG